MANEVVQKQRLDAGSRCTQLLEDHCQQQRDVRAPLAQSRNVNVLGKAGEKIVLQRLERAIGRCNQATLRRPALAVGLLAGLR
jgi:hypothetical protein